MREADHSLFQPASRFCFAHLQLPLWLFQGEYTELSMNARVVFAFLLSRFRLSQANSQTHAGEWVNEEGALFIIYPRARIAEDLHISLNSACTCMKELAAANLIIEERKGQGKANRIYLIDSPRLHSSSCEKNGSDENQTEAAPTEKGMPPEPAGHGLPGPGETAAEASPESQDSIFFTPPPCDSGIENSPSPESQKTVRKYNNTSDNEVKYTKGNYTAAPSSVSPHPSAEAGQTENGQTDELDEICKKSGLELLQNAAYGYTAKNYKLMREAMHYLYFLNSLSIQEVRYSREYVRRRMHEITVETLDMALERIRQQPRKIRKIVAYAAKTLFSCIMEREAEGALESGASGGNETAPGALGEALFSEMGENRKPTVSESKLIAYAEENGFSPEDMRELVRETMERTGGFRVEAARGILREWGRQGGSGGNAEESACGEWEREWLEGVRLFAQRQGG